MQSSNPSLSKIVHKSHNVMYSAQRTTYTRTITKIISQKHTVFPTQCVASEESKGWEQPNEMVYAKKKNQESRIKNQEITSEVW